MILLLLKKIITQKGKKLITKSNRHILNFISHLRLIVKKSNITKENVNQQQFLLSHELILVYRDITLYMQ
jgi:hypothetical protein